MTKFSASQPSVISMPVTSYTGPQGLPLPLVEKKPFEQENLQLEVLGLRLINEAQRKELVRLKDQLRKLGSSI